MKIDHYGKDERIILTLDAGGTNFVFSAIRGNKEIVSPIRMPAYPDDLDRCIETVIHGFVAVNETLDERPAAISFAFPGPADYASGIIGDLPNFPAFKGGVPLGPVLEDRFGIPVFINNDGNLFAYGEALSGYLPWLNGQLEAAGSSRRYSNLVGFTLGTGFGSGLVLGDTMILGHSTSGAEIHNTLNPFDSRWNAEEGVSTRAIQRVYAEKAGKEFDSSLMPGDIYKIAQGSLEGKREAALEAFRAYGRSLGGSVANTLSLFDGIVVFGGGITAGWDLFSGEMCKELNRSYLDFRGNASPRLSYAVYNLEDEGAFNEFAEGGMTSLEVPGSGRKVQYYGEPRTGVGRSKLGASTAIGLGAYAFALHKLDQS